MLKKLKSIILDDTFYIAFLLILVGVGSFGLGRLSMDSSLDKMATVSMATLPAITSSSSKGLAAGVMVETTPTSTKSQNVEQTGAFVASKSGTKYHKLTCPGAKQIKESNKVYFSSEDEAQASGYTRAANCKF